jgi:hypothetical protein
MLETMFGNCYAGAWGWSYDGVDSAGNWAGMSGPLATFNAAHSADLNITSGGAAQPTATTTATATATPKATATATATATPKATATATATPQTTATSPSSYPAPATATPTQALPTATSPSSYPAPATATPTQAPATTTATPTKAPTTPTTTPTKAPPTATATPPAGATAKVIYADVLSAGWVNWSWSTKIVLNYANTVKVGKRSISATHQAQWAGLRVHTDTPLATTGLRTVRFWVNGGTRGGQALWLYVENGKGWRSPFVSLPTPKANTWTLVEVPLSQLGSPAVIADLAIQEAGGTYNRAFYVDQIEVAP